MPILSRLVGGLILAAITVRGVAAPSDVEVFEKLTPLAQSGSVAAQYSLGLFYRDGIGTAKDLRAALRWFESAAATGDALASYELGCYYDGQYAGVVPQDRERAFAAKLIAAEGGYDRAQRDVGNFYAAKGDIAEAIRWWTLAADQLDTAAKLALSEAYRKGRGVQKDPAKALELTLLVGEILPSSGHATPGLSSRISSLKSEATPEQVAVAERAAMNWRPRVTALTARGYGGLLEAARLVQ